MPDVFFGTFNTDLTPPTVDNRVPAPSSSAVPESTTFEFDVTDFSGVDTAFLQVSLNAAPVVVNGAAVSGYSVAYTPIVDGFRVVVTRALPLDSVATYSLSVTARDQAPLYNEATYSWSFSTGDTVLPLVVNTQPPDLSVNVSALSAISFDVIDGAGSGINLPSLSVTLTDNASTVVDVIVSGVPQPPFIVTTTVVSGGFRVSVTRTGGLSKDQTYTVDVSVQDASGNTGTGSWSWSTESGVVETPRLSAVGGQGQVYTSWYVNPAMSVESFVLRRSTAGPPTDPESGLLVYTGTEKKFIDTNVVDGQRYFYTVFVVRFLVSGVPQYVPYSPLASAGATTTLVRVAEPVIPEYVPVPQEFGITTMPWDGGSISQVWGAEDPFGRRRQNDLWVLPRGRPIRAPVTGTITESGDKSMVIETSLGIRISISGQLAPSPATGIGTRVQTGDLLASAGGGAIEFSVFRLPSGRDGLRSIRPTYFYRTVERRL